jgi:hypothetical protein
VNILKKLYDMGLLEEEGILSWAEKVSKKYISKELATKLHENAKPLVDWLKWVFSSLPLDPLRALTRASNFTQGC